MAHDGGTHSGAVTALRIDEFVGSQGLECIADDFRDLFARMGKRSFVHSLGWHRAFVAHLSERADDVRFYVFRRGTHVCAIVALRAGSAAKWVRVRRSSLLTHRHATLSDALVAPGENIDDVVGALAGRVGAGALASIIELPNLIAGRSALGALQERAGARDAPRLLVEAVGASAWFDTTSRAAALAGVSSHARRNLGRQRRRLEEMGAVVVERLVGVRAAEEGVDRFVALEASGWKGAAGSAIRMHPRLLGFYRSLARELDSCPSVVVYLLHVAGRVVAGSFCIELDDTLHVLKIAYDEDLRAAAPGNRLLDHMLDEAAGREALRRVSLVTSPPWAQRWGARNDELRRVLVFPPGLRGTLLLTALRLRRRLRGRSLAGQGEAHSVP